MHVMRRTPSLQSLAFILILVIKGSHESSLKVTGSGGQKCLTCELSEKRKRETGSEVLPNDTSLLVQSVSQLPYTTEHTDLQVFVSGKEEEANLTEPDHGCACPDQEGEERESSTVEGSGEESNIQKPPSLLQSSSHKTCPCPVTQNKDGEEKVKSTLVGKNPISLNNNTELQIIQEQRTDYSRTTKKMRTLPTFSCEKYLPQEVSNGRQCPVCKTTGFQDCTGKLNFCRYLNTMCLTLFARVRIDNEDANVTLKCCTTKQFCDHAFTELEGYPIKIMKKICLIAPYADSGSSGGSSELCILILLALLQTALVF